MYKIHFSQWKLKLFCECKLSVIKTYYIQHGIIIVVEIGIKSEEAQNVSSFLFLIYAFVHFYSPLQLAFQEEARTALSNLGQGSSASQQRKRHANIQDSVCGRWSTARLFDKAILLFDGGHYYCCNVHIIIYLC